MVKIKTSKAEFLKLLEEEPKYEDDGHAPEIEGWQEAREKWEESVKTEFYQNVLGIYEESHYLEEQVDELKDEVNELKNLLKTHIHNGVKVYAEL